MIITSKYVSRIKCTPITITIDRHTNQHYHHTEHLPTTAESSLLSLLHRASSHRGSHGPLPVVATCCCRCCCCRCCLRCCNLVLVARWRNDDGDAVNAAQEDTSRAVAAHATVGRLVLLRYTAATAILLFLFCCLCAGVAASFPSLLPASLLGLGGTAALLSGHAKTFGNDSRSLR